MHVPHVFFYACFQQINVSSSRFCGELRVISFSHQHYVSRLFSLFVKPCIKQRSCFTLVLEGVEWNAGTFDVWAKFHNLQMSEIPVEKQHTSVLSCPDCQLLMR